MTGRRRHDLVGMSGRVGALAPARHARRVRLPEAFFPPGERGLFSTVRPKTLKKKGRGALAIKRPILLSGLSESTRLPHRCRMRCRGLPTTTPTSRGLHEPISPRKKCAIWTRWRPVPGKNANYLRAPSSRRSGLVGSYTTQTIVNYKYRTSTS